MTEQKKATLPRRKITLTPPRKATPGPGHPRKPLRPLPHGRRRR